MFADLFDMTNKAYVQWEFSTIPSVSFSDSFSSLNSTAWEDSTSGSGVSESVSSGLNLSCTNGAVGSSGLCGKSSIDMTVGSYVTAKIGSLWSNYWTHNQMVSGLALVGAATTSFSPWPAHYVAIYMEGFNLYVGTETGVTNEYSGTIGWDYMRLRQQGSTLYFETSSDNATWQTWTSQATSTTSLTLSAVYPVLFGSAATAPSAATASFSAYATGLTYGVAIAQVSNIVIVNSSGVPTNWSGDGVVPTTIYTTIDVHDSDQKIRQSLTSAIQTAMSDSTLDVDFIG